MLHLLNRSTVANGDDGAIAADGAQVWIRHNRPEMRLCPLWHVLLQLQPDTAMVASRSIHRTFKYFLLQVMHDARTKYYEHLL
jgi:hypothetical protein